jgi:hypothetical protein
MISSVRPLYVGNALQVTLAPPAGAVQWRILRKETNTFTDQDDPGALLAFEGRDTVVTDAEPGLVNETPIYYKPFYQDDAGAWSTAPAVSGTPLATYEEHSTDVLRLVRNRLEDGLKVEVQRGTFVLEGGRDVIAVYSAPPAAGAVDLPVVTVHLASERAEASAMGELIVPDTLLPGGDWLEHEGREADVQLEIVGWCLNPDERIAMRQAIRRLLMANLGVFAAAGMNEVAFQFQDLDAINGEYAANVYQAMCTLTCKAPVVVINRVTPIADVQITFSAEEIPTH